MSSSILFYTIYALGSIYIGFHVYQWLRQFRKMHVLPMVLYVLPAAVPFVLLFLPVNHALYAPLTVVQGYFFGFELFLGMGIVVVDLILLLSLPVLKKALFSRHTLLAGLGFVCLLFALGMSVYSSINAHSLRVTPYEVTIGKTVPGTDSVKIVLISDTHYGTFSGKDDAEKLAAAVNQEKPDLVVIAGDLFDSTCSALKDADGVARALSKMESKYGTFFAYGNHDEREPKEKRTPEEIEKDLEITAQFFKEAGITVLKDSEILINDSFYLVGHDDGTHAKSYGHARKKIGELTKDLDERLPIILIDHMPTDYGISASSGADLLLSGHTHGGQLFPATVYYHLKYENAYGLKKVNKMTAVTTSGVGAPLIPMRFCTHAEIAVITVSFR